MWNYQGECDKKKLTFRNCPQLLKLFCSDMGIFVFPQNRTNLKLMKPETEKTNIKKYTNDSLGEKILDIELT